MNHEPPNRSRRSPGRRILSKLLIAGLICTAGLFVLAAMAKRPDNLGISGGGFAPCPDSPNCVSTRTDASDPHFMEPMDFLSGGGDSTRAAVLAAIEALPRTRIIEQADDYLYAECTSLIFRFVDDLEVHFDDARQQVHFRSASRVGHSDMGANRKRVEQIKSKASGE